MRPIYKFECMFRGKQVIIEYEYELDLSKKVEYAIISYDTPNFIHPDYLHGEDSLNEFHWEVYQLAKDHIKKVKAA